MSLVLFKIAGHLCVKSRLERRLPLMHGFCCQPILKLKVSTSFCSSPPHQETAIKTELAMRQVHNKKQRGHS